MFVQSQLHPQSRATMPMPMRPQDDRMRMHQQDDRLMRLRLMQLNERVRRWISDGEAGGHYAEPTESPSKKMRRSLDCGHSRQENRRPSEPCQGDGREQDHPQPQQQPQRPQEQQKPRRPGRRVRFSETSTAVILPRPTSEDRRESWYTRSDVAGFKRLTKLHAASLGATRTARLMKRVAYLAATTHDGAGQADGQAPPTTPDAPAGPGSLGGRIDALRGMEHLVCPTVARLLLQRRRAVLRRVLEEQSLAGRDGGAEGTERIARASREASSFSREWTRRVLELHREAP